MCVHVIQISLEFRNLAREYRDVISDICHRMGVGMAEFLEKKVGSMKEWDQVSASIAFCYMCYVLLTFTVVNYTNTH